MKNCANCGIPQDDDWPDGQGNNLCQLCWEAQCSDAWWAAMDRIHGVDDGKELDGNI